MPEAVSERRLALKRKNKDNAVVVRNPKHSKLIDTFENNIQVIGNDVEITGVRPVHLRERMERKLKNLRKKRKKNVHIPEELKKTRAAADFSNLGNKPYIDFQLNLDATDKKRENVITDQIQQNLPPDNDFFYTE